MTTVIRVTGGLPGISTTASIGGVDFECRPDETPYEFEMRVLKSAKPGEIVVIGGLPKSMELGDW